MAKQFGNCWLSRDAGELWAGYNVSKSRPRRNKEGNWIGVTMSLFDVRMFHRLTDVRLKPGDGPMRAQLSIKL